jgi:hypothetical protein
MEFKGKQTRFSQPKTRSFVSAMVWPNSPKKISIGEPFLPNQPLSPLAMRYGRRKETSAEASDKARLLSAFLTVSYIIDERPAACKCSPAVPTRFSGLFLPKQA